MGHIRIILADCNYVHIEQLQQQWENELDFELCAAVTTGTALMTQIGRMKPDVLIMDLALKEMDGLEVLRRLQDHEQKPTIIVYSAMLNDAMIKQCAVYGVDYFVQKPTEALTLARRIRSLCEGEQERRISAYENDAFLAQSRLQVSQLLNGIGMPNKLNGYRYLRRALLYVLESPKLLDDLTAGLYAQVAREENTTATNVERSIRYAIEFVFMYGSLETLQDLFGFTINSNKGKPSNREFIAMMTDHLAISLAALPA